MIITQVTQPHPSLSRKGIGSRTDQRDRIEPLIPGQQALRTPLSPGHVGGRGQAMGWSPNPVTWGGRRRRGGAGKGGERKGGGRRRGEELRGQEAE